MQEEHNRAVCFDPWQVSSEYVHDDSIYHCGKVFFIEIMLGIDMDDISRTKCPEVKENNFRYR